MMALPSLRLRFLRIFISIASVTTVLISLGLSVDDYIYQRRTQTENMQQIASAVSRILAVVFAHDDSTQIASYLESFADNPRLIRLCIYNENNHLRSLWQRAGSAENCPEHMTKSGIETDAFFVHIASPMQQEGKYSGMVYVQGDLYTTNQWLWCLGKVLAALLAMAVSACFLAAHLSAKSVAAPILALTRQVQCLRGGDIVACSIPALSMTTETAELSTQIADLRTHFDKTTVPRPLLANVYGWQWELLSGLLASLRHRLNADSPLLENLNDYALFLQTERGDILSPPRVFDLARVLDNALAQARAACPPSAEINLTVSLAPDMQRQWIGHPEVMEALLRHLLLIALKRVRSGFICLRIEPHAQTHIDAYGIRIALQDSGPHVQYWQLQQWLSLPKDDVPPLAMAKDISWLLAVRLFKRLGGTLAGTGGEESGLSLEGNLSLLPYEARLQTIAAPVFALATPSAPLLVLIIETQKENMESTRRLFTEAGVKAFMVHTHKEALEWAPVLPFSAIIFGANVEGAQDTLRRLRHMAEDNIMPKFPLWMLTAQVSFIDFDYWRQQGISELLLKPLSTHNITPLLINLPHYDSRFYLAQHTSLHHDILPSTHSSADMTQMLATQIAQVEPVVKSLAENQPFKNGRDIAHAGRSGALTLGYFRLAALMGQIEYAAHSGRTSFPAKNWQLVLEMMHSGLLADTSVQP